ncbi:MAG: mechanosensitive ion channel [Dinoroseobacter sp.]|nr:mechanosensitive ion channel [Dinoroseobacter sp.]
MNEDLSPVDYVENLSTAYSSWSETLDLQTLIIVVVAIGVVVVLRKRLAELFVKFGMAILNRLNADLGDEVRPKLVEAAEVLLVALACYIGLETISPPEIAGGLLKRLIISVAVIAVFTAWYRLAGVFIAQLRDDRFDEIRVEKDWMVRVAKFAITLLGISALLEVWEIDISSALTGVGVLGAGLAIAAQDLVRNLIAGMTNLSEERFETGDAIEVPGMLMGTVERIDLRSTLIVGFDQIPRHVPNAELANSVVLNYSRTRRRRVLMKVGLVLGTSEAQVRQVKEGVQTYLATSGMFAIDDASPRYVYAQEITDHAIEFLIIALTVTGGYEDMLQARESLNLKILELVEAAGTELAYPTQTIETRVEEVGKV